MGYKIILLVFCVIGFIFTSNSSTNTTCFGVLYNETEVCQSHGTCIGTDNCSCDSNYTQPDCGWRCFGFEKDDDDGCSGHGLCIDHNNCSCTGGDVYSGINCGTWTCAGVPMDDISNVCNGRGSCLDHNFCLCQTGYSSSDVESPCDEWYCGEFFKSDANACSKRGVCVSSHFCSCSGGYEGALCDTWSCGFDYKMSITCSGHGTCLAPDDCDCNTGYDGDMCETNMMYATVMAPILSVGGVLGLFVVVIIIGVLICCFYCCVCIFLCAILALIVAAVNLRFRMKKFKKLKNFDVLLKEQQMEEDESVAHIRIDHSLFEIDMDEISLVSILGEGGSASVVYLANWKNQEIAFKAFKTRVVCSNQDSFDEFEREIAVLASVSHPNIIRCFGASIKPPRVGIVIEYCQNGDMQVFLSNFKKANEKSYPMIEKTRLCLETCLACDYLHSRSIIHRDLKLENVLLDEKEVCKLMDFGLSKIVDRMSRQKTVKIGTSVFMAPEIVLSGSYDTKVDVFSFGMMVYIIFTEKFMPFGIHAEEQGSVEMKVATNPKYRPHIAPVRALGQEWSWLEKIITTCWDHHPSKRPPFGELSKAFKEKLEEMRKKPENVNIDSIRLSRPSSLLIMRDQMMKKKKKKEEGDFTEEENMLQKEIDTIQKECQNLKVRMKKKDREGKQLIRKMEIETEELILRKDEEIERLAAEVEKLRELIKTPQEEVGVERVAVI